MLLSLSQREDAIRQNCNYGYMYSSELQLWILVFEKGHCYLIAGGGGGVEDSNFL